MKITFKIFVYLATIAVLSGCHFGMGGADAFGLLYSDVTHSPNKETVIGLKKGEACQVSFLSLVAVGNNSIVQAALIGAIREVTNVTVSVQSVLMGILWQKNCTAVYGR